MKKLLLAAVAGAALLSTGASHANATPSLSIEVFDGATLLGSATNPASAALFLTGTTNYSLISVIASGVPNLPTPNLNSINLDTTSKAPSTLTVLVTQTGLTNPFPINLASSFTINALTGPSELVIISNYIDAANVAFATTTLIASDMATYTVVGSAGPIGYAAPAMALFSETQKYLITFDGANELVSLSSQIVDAPEPASMALLGAGMFGIGLIKRAKKASGQGRAA